ncbi:MULTISPECIES: YufK family protein [unclassified Bacillus (in: firmicutes)]|uniref:YufK family protein n=1 Tax=Bacillus TaxID=1386 RepID=UPI00338FE6E0
MKNTYLTGYFPLISILLFSSAFSIFTVGITTDLLTQAGILKGMLEFFSEQGIRLALFAAFALVYFMILSALKLIADTILELSLLFFARDPEGENLKKIRISSLVYLFASLLAFIFTQQLILLVGLFVVASLVYFIWVVVRIYQSLSMWNLIGFMMFIILFWATFLIGILYLFMKLYNSVMASLPS